MKNKTSLLISLLCLGAVLLTGCTGAHHATTRKQVAAIVQIGTTVGATQDPTIVPYLRVGAEVVCEASKGTNALPDYVVQQMATNRLALSFKTPLAVAVWNSAFGIYEGLYEDYLDEPIENQLFWKDWLGGTCDGLLATVNLFPSLKDKKTGKLRTYQRPYKLPPHITYP